MSLFTQNRDVEDFMVLAMTIAAAADGIDSVEEDAIFSLMNQLPRLRNINQQYTLNAAMDFIVQNGYENSINYFSNIMDINITKTILILVLEISMANDNVSLDEEDVIVQFANAMNVDDFTLNKIVDVITWKFD